MKKLLILVALMAIMAIGSHAQAATIWTEPFTSAADWSVSGGTGTITSNGTQGLFDAPNASSSLTGIYDKTKGPAFDPVNKSNYDWVFKTDGVTGSMSYEIALDTFDSSLVYINSVYVQPNDTFVGTKTVNLGGFTFNGSTAYISPKVTVYTGLA
ncbi:MAG: hypothetical protein Q8O36_05105, partial [Candidatus Omnitrophota bacterium]|nr:hypothetical protein [Candidatus Omnitrophota bacterium]